MINRKPTLPKLAKATLASALTLSAFACHSGGMKTAQQTPQNQLKSNTGTTQGTSETVSSQPEGMQVSSLSIDSRANTAQGDVPNLVVYKVELNGNSVPLSNLLLEPNSTFSSQVGDLTYVGQAKCVTPQCSEIAVFVTASSAKSDQTQQAATIFGQNGSKGGWIAEVTSPANAQYKSIDDAIQSLMEIRNYRENEYGGNTKAPAPSPSQSPAPAAKGPAQRDLSTQVLNGSLGG